MIISAQPINAAEVLKETDLFNAKNLHVDSRVIRLLNEGNIVYPVRFITSDNFLKLIFHEVDDSRLLTPPGMRRSLKDIIIRMKGSGWHIDDLSKQLNLPSNMHDPNWFKQCFEIYKTFDEKKFTPLYLMESTLPEIAQTPGSPYHIYDGTHRSLVFAWKIMVEDYQFFPIQAYLFKPRPSNV